MLFEDRRDAGRQLARALQAYQQARNTLLLALPRGGVPVAFEVAQQLELPLEPLLVRKLGVPTQPELAFGAIASGGARFVNQSLVSQLGLTRQQIAEVEKQEAMELQRREQHYRGKTLDLALRSQQLIIIDDGIATGATMMAAVQAVQSAHPKDILVAIPCAPKESYQRLSKHAGVICLLQPEPFVAVGRWYQNFTQTSDAEVIELLRHSRASSANGADRSDVQDERARR